MRGANFCDDFAAPLTLTNSISFPSFPAGGKGDTYHNGKLVPEGVEQKVSVLLLLFSVLPRYLPIYTRAAAAVGIHCLIHLFVFFLSLQMEIYDRLAIGDQLMRLQWKDHEEGLGEYFVLFLIFVSQPGCALYLPECNTQFVPHLTFASSSYVILLMVTTLQVSR